MAQSEYEYYFRCAAMCAFDGLSPSGKEKAFQFIKNLLEVEKK